LDGNPILLRAAGVSRRRSNLLRKDARYTALCVPKFFYKELNLISWNEHDPKYGIRDWGPDGEKMGKGLTLSKEVLLALKELLNVMDF
jgi:hypothetical protein